MSQGKAHVGAGSSARNLSKASWLFLSPCALEALDGQTSASLVLGVRWFAALSHSLPFISSPQLGKGDGE